MVVPLALLLHLAIAPLEGDEPPPVQRPRGMPPPTAPPRPETPFEAEPPPEPEKPASSEPSAEPVAPPQELSEPPPESPLVEPPRRTIPPAAAPKALPPPRGRGHGLLIAGGVVGAAGLLQQLGVYAAVKNHCSGDIGDSQVTGTQVAFLDCMMESPGGMVLRSVSALNLGAAIGLIATGSVRRGRWHAHDDVSQGFQLNVRSRVAAGATLVALGAVAWVTTRVLVRTHRIGCGTERCAVAADMLTLDAAAAAVAAGAGLLGYGIAYRKRHRRLTGTTARFSPILAPGRVGLGVFASF